ncbi:MAG: hypothetical protein J6Q02_01880 [Lachnospiraceae bacterium]|nr:hypothetical protein [Lachnospiraceae bacterium]
MKKKKTYVAKKRKPVDKKKFLCALLIILAAAILITFFFLWYFRKWIFKPKLEFSSLSFSTDFLYNGEDPAPPSEQQMQEVAAFVADLNKQAKHQLTIGQRRDAKKLVKLVSAINSGNMDTEAVLKDLGVKIKKESGKTTGSIQDGTSDPLQSDGGPYSASASTQSLVRGRGGALLVASHLAHPSIAILTGASVESMADGQEAGAEATSEQQIENLGDLLNTFANSGETYELLPASRIHPSKMAVGPVTTTPITCRMCQHENPPTLNNCEQCGYLLRDDPNYTMVDPLEPDPEILAAGSGLTEEEREALLLSNVSNQLLFSNNSALSFYLATLACMEDPTSVSAITTLVTHLRMRGYDEEAILICAHGLALDPQREELYVHAGYACIQLDDPDQALAFLNREIETCGFSGPTYQAMTFAWLQKQDWKKAFRCMIEGARDGYISSLKIVYDMMKLRPDYWEIAGSAFKDYTVRSLMDFSFNRSGFNPAQELQGKVVDIGACKVPATPEDWIASSMTMIQNGQNYAQGAASFYAEDIQDIADVYNILFTSEDLKDMAGKFMAKFGEKYKKEKLTEEERIISYEQEVFWLDILDDYREWKVKSIREDMDKQLENSDFEQIMQIAFKYLGKRAEKLEALDQHFSIPNMLETLEIMFSLHDNMSIGFTEDESAVIVPKIKNALRVNANVRNKGYQEIGELLHDYYMYSNAILGLVADKELYVDYRREITLNVTTDQGICVLENAMYAVMVPILAEPYLLIGQQTHEGITEGSVTGYTPPYPKFIVSDKPPRPTGDLYANILVPDINKVTLKLLGRDGTGYDNPQDNGKSNYPLWENYWKMQWQNQHPGETPPTPPNFNDPAVRDSFYNNMTPQERVEFSSIIAHQGVMRGSIQLNTYCGKGHSVVDFKFEDIPINNGMSFGYNNGLTNAQYNADGTVEIGAGGGQYTEDNGDGTSTTTTDSGFGMSMKPDGTITGQATIGEVGKITIDSNNNWSVTMKDKPSGLNGGLRRTGRDITAFVGTDAKIEGKIKQGPLYGNSGLSIGADGQLYMTHSLGTGQTTSGGAKSGFHAVLAGLIGIGVNQNTNLVQGLGTAEVYIIIAGRKITGKWQSDWNTSDAKDAREKKNVPGLQEFHK